MASGPQPAGYRQLVPFAALSASYFAHIGFFNPYLPLWLKAQGLPITVISLLASVQSLTRVFAPYAWGALSDRTGERVKLLRLSATIALVASLGLWWPGGAWWIGLVLLLLFTHTSSMMGLTEAAMAHLVAGDWGRYGKVRLWGSMGFMVTVFVAGAWFERFGMGSFPGWTLVTLACVLLCTWCLPDAREAAHETRAAPEPIGAALRRPVVRWFFASLLFHVMAHFAIYGFLSLYLDALGYSKTTIGLLWAVSVIVEIAWFYAQGRLIVRFPMEQWLLLCALATSLRMAITAGLGGWIAALFVAQMLHALSFATHHTACIALVTKHFPGRLRARGQALFTVIGYGIGGVIGVLAGGAIAARWGFQPLFAAAALLGLLAAGCAWRVQVLQGRDAVLV
ncbi:major facilitator superfamily domain-containing protein 6 [Ramlibacter monticola]|uniref:MFS transporter n=1 Tax=Ramlibacter monticola TaxID=1926872 RepID=A0A936ZA25_9BURK|nr:MFS transporter [Ramlibacter monticola]MBL0395066.1 MFS transporter [Ramlibacter monticola]